MFSLIVLAMFGAVVLPIEAVAMGLAARGVGSTQAGFRVQARCVASLLVAGIGFLAATVAVSARLVPAPPALPRVVTAATPPLPAFDAAGARPTSGRPRHWCR